MNAELRIGIPVGITDTGVISFIPPRLPSSVMLTCYAKKYDAVEINNRFCKLPAEDALLRWREVAPLGFLFSSVKASRFITHIKRLREASGFVQINKTA
jgi:uncharacterized protein YecE (DUF72 family)